MMNKKHDRCGICSTPVFERNLYYYGKLMTARDFQAEQDYFNEKRWLINRMILGHGVVCGFDVWFKPESHYTLVIAPGLAIDCCGREILVCDQQEINVKPKLDHCQRDQHTGKPTEPLLVCLEYEAQKTEPVNLPPIACDNEGKTEYNRMRDGFRISLKLESEIKREAPAEKAEAFAYDKKGWLHGYVCQYLKECPECEGSGCLILARLVPHHEPHIPENPPFKLYTCRDRKLVYNNKLLYELIEHCLGEERPEKPVHLPHIVDIGWRECHARHPHTIDWRAFRALLENGLTVYFDHHMVGASINQHSFLVSVTIKERGTGYFVQKFVPASTIEYQEDENGSRATFYADSAWFGDEVVSKNSEIAAGIVRMEIRLRGSAIMGKNGKALDGEFIGNVLPSGNGVQGGDFVSCFSVTPRV